MTNNTSTHRSIRSTRALAGFSISDQWRPNDRLNVNLGLRIENFTYHLRRHRIRTIRRGSSGSTHYNAEYCFAPGQQHKPIDRTNNDVGACPIVNGVPRSAQSPLRTAGEHRGGIRTRRPASSRGSASRTRSTRITCCAARSACTRVRRTRRGSSTTINRRPADVSGQHFYGYGFNTPDHLIRPDTSYNYDLSWEQRLKGTDWSFKLSPFFRATRDQLQNFYIDPQGGLESGLNVGNQAVVAASSSRCRRATSRKTAERAALLHLHAQPDQVSELHRN